MTGSKAGYSTKSINPTFKSLSTPTPRVLIIHFFLLLILIIIYFYPYSPPYFFNHLHFKLLILVAGGYCSVGGYARKINKNVVCSFGIIVYKFVHPLTVKLHNVTHRRKINESASIVINFCFVTYPCVICSWNPDMSLVNASLRQYIRERVGANIG